MIVRNFLFSESHAFEQKLQEKQKIPQIFCWKSGNMSQAPLRLPQRDRRGDARFGTKSRVCNSTDGAPSCIDYQSTTMPTGAHNFKRQLVHTRRAPRGCSQPGEEAGGRRGSVSAPDPPSLADGAPSSHIHVGGGTVKIEGADTAPRSADTAPSCRPSNPHMGRGARPGRKFHAMVAVPKNG